MLSFTFIVFSVLVWWAIVTTAWLATSKAARSHCVLYGAICMPIRKLSWALDVNGRDRDETETSASGDRDVGNFSRGQTETRRWYISRPSRDRDIETETSRPRPQLCSEQLLALVSQSVTVLRQTVRIWRERIIYIPACIEFCFYRHQRRWNMWPFPAAFACFCTPSPCEIRGACIRWPDCQYYAYVMNPLRRRCKTLRGCVQCARHRVITNDKKALW